MNFLKKALNTTAVLAVTAGVAFTAIDAKAEDAGTTITATVQNAITWVETQPLQFGTFVAISDATDTSTLAIDTAGASTVTNPGAARIVEITTGQQGVFTASAAAPSTSVTLTLPASVTLTCGACVGTPPDFTVNAFNHDAGVTPTTDGSGGLVVNVGATLNTVASAAAYEDGAYTGAYTVSINY